MCGWHMSSSSEISPKILLLCRPDVICMRFQPQKYFQLNSRATALLKSGDVWGNPFLVEPLFEESYRSDKQEKAAENREKCHI